jgi:hypothetical protein
MSIQAVASVLETEVGEVSAKMLLISLANAHNTGTGLCCPTIDRLVKETGMGRTTVKRWLAWLEAHKFIRIEQTFEANGRQQAHRYTLTLGEGSNLGGVQKREGSNSEPHEGSNCGLPLKKPEEYRKNNIIKRTVREELETALDTERSEAVIEHRQRIRKPLTAHAAKLLAGKFAKCPDPNTAADAMIANGWQGFEPEWMERSQPRAAPTSSPSALGRNSRPKSVSEMLRDRRLNGTTADDDRYSGTLVIDASSNLPQLPDR